MRVFGRFVGFSVANRLCNGRFATGVVLIFLGLFPPVKGCSAPPEVARSGKLLLFWETKVLTYNFEQNEFRSEDLGLDKMLDLSVLSEGANGSLIIAVRNRINHKFTFQNNSVTGPVIICRYIHSTKELTQVSKPDDSLLYISSLDFFGETSEYVLSGLYDNIRQRRVLILDSTFNVVSDLTSQIDSSFGGFYPSTNKAFRVTSNKFLLQTLNEGYPEVYLYDNSTGKSTFISDGKIRCLSRDNRSAILTKGYKEGADHYLMVYGNGFTLKPILEDVYVTDITFSPMKDRVAYVVQTYDLYNTEELWIYDLVSKAREYTGQHVKGSVVWVE